MTIISGKVTNAKLFVLGRVAEACDFASLHNGDYYPGPVSRALDYLIAAVRVEERADGNQAATQSSGVNRGSAAQNNASANCSPVEDVSGCLYCESAWPLDGMVHLTPNGRFPCVKGLPVPQIPDGAGTEPRPRNGETMETTITHTVNKLVWGRDAAFWHESYALLRDAVCEHLDPHDDEVAEEAIMIKAIEVAGQRLKAVSDAAFHVVMQYGAGTEESTREAVRALEGLFADIDEGKPIGSVSDSVGEEKDHGAGLIRQTIPDVAGTEPRLNDELLNQLRAAHDALCEAVQRQWDRKPAFRLSIPAQRKADGDLMISDALITAIEFVKQFQVGGCPPNTTNKAASPCGDLSIASHQPESEFGSGTDSAGEASGIVGQERSAQEPDATSRTQTGYFDRSDPAQEPEK